MQYINLNGSILNATDVRISPDNGAFRYGHGLFETMLLRDGMIRLLAYHAERLLHGMRQLGFDVPAFLTTDWIQEQVLATARANGLVALCRVRLQVFAQEPGAGVPGILIECSAIDAGITRLNEEGLKMGMATGLLKSNDSLANLKTCNALIYIMAAQQARQNGWDEALICNTAGNIIESTIANIFWIKDGDIYTPPLSEGCIAGVMRRYIMKQSPVYEQPLTEIILQHADEVFLTNALRAVRWVKTINGTEYGNECIKAIYATLCLE